MKKQGKGRDWKLEERIDGEGRKEQAKTWTRMFTAAVFGIAPNWKLKCPSMGEWLKKLQRIHSYGKES